MNRNCDTRPVGEGVCRNEILSVHNPIACLRADELLAALKKLSIKTRGLNLGKLTFREQAEAMQHCAVLAGGHGAGLLPSIYAPRTTPVVQLAPKGCSFCKQQFGGVLEKVWHS